ncbi:MAG: hypothetical protein N3D10_01275 [Candidatus Micrarchaeota archaeon]|nr:hypothetical protein [Candidatus Micrarchaeota archaeon]
MMNPEKYVELFKSLNLIEVDFDRNKSLEQNLSSYLSRLYGLSESQALKIAKKLKRGGIVALNTNGSLNLFPNSLTEVSKLFLSEKFLEIVLNLHLEKQENKKEEKAQPINLELQVSPSKHLEDILKDQIVKLLDEFFEVIEKDKQSEYKIVREFAKEIDQKIQRKIQEKKELTNDEINEIAAYLQSRRAYYQTLESAQMFAKMDLKSKNPTLAQTAKAILELINNKNMGIEDIQGLNFYVMQRSRYEYIFENGFLYAEKELREEKDENKINQARKILGILSKNNPTPQEIFELAAYVDRKEFEGSVEIIKDLITKEENEANKEYIQRILQRIEENTPLSILDLTALRSYYVEKITPSIQEGLALLKNRTDEWAKSILDTINQKGVLNPFQIQEIYSFIKKQKALEQASSTASQQQTASLEEQLAKTKIIENSIIQSAKEEAEKYLINTLLKNKVTKEDIIALIENIVHKANELQDENKIDYILEKIEKAEKQLNSIQSLKSAKVQEKKYASLYSELKELEKQI